jgi:hypothetical protein
LIIERFVRSSFSRWGYERFDIGIQREADKVHTRSSTAQMTMCVYCSTPRWRYASCQELCKKCGRFQPREVQPA